ncbi:MAG: hypothetical protein AB8G99_17140, partial [Planctomycetaceae bacterium]
CRMVIWSAFCFLAVRRSLSTGQVELGLLVLSAVMLFFSSKKYVTYRNVVPEERLGSHDPD